MLDRVTLRMRRSSWSGCNVENVASGFGSMPMGNVGRGRHWHLHLRPDAWRNAIRRVAASQTFIMATMLRAPHRHHRTKSNRSFSVGDEFIRENNLPEPMPKLATLVVASAFDAALHDAYGKSNT